MFEELAYIYEGSPFAGLLALLSPALFLIALLTLHLSIRRRYRLRRHPDAPLTIWPELFGLSVLIMPLPLGVVGWRMGSNRLVYSLDHPEGPSKLAIGLASGIANSMNVDMVLSFLMPVLSVLTGIGLGGLVAARFRHGGARAQWLAGLGTGLCVFSIAVLCAGAALKTSAAHSTFNAIASAAPENKALQLKQGLETALPALTSAGKASLASLLFGALLVSLALITSPQRSGGSGALIYSTVVFLVAAALIFEARHFAAEVRGPPIPFLAQGHLFSTQGPTTPQLIGPDELTGAPVITLTADRMDIEDVVTPSFEALSEKLAMMRKIELMMYPEEKPRVRALLRATGEVRGAQILSTFSSFLPAGYTEIVLAFQIPGALQRRPLLGERVAARQSGAILHLVTSALQDEEKATTFSISPNESYAEIAARVVEARKLGKQVRVIMNDPS